jgi:hypothetical protein
MFSKQGNPICYLVGDDALLKPYTYNRSAKNMHFNYLDWGVLELTSKEEELLGVQNAQAVTLQLVAFQNSFYLANTSHSCFPSTIFKFAPTTML